MAITPARCQSTGNLRGECSTGIACPKSLSGHVRKFKIIRAGFRHKPHQQSFPGVSWRRADYKLYRSWFWTSLDARTHAWTNRFRQRPKNTSEIPLPFLSPQRASLATWGSRDYIICEKIGQEKRRALSVWMSSSSPLTFVYQLSTEPRFLEAFWPMMHRRTNQSEPFRSGQKQKARWVLPTGIFRYWAIHLWPSDFLRATFKSLSWRIPWKCITGEPHFY